MEKLQNFINKYCNYLYDDYNFKVVDSSTSKSFGGDSMLVLESAELRLKIVSDRGAIYFDFQGKYDEKKSDWYDLDVVRSLIKNPNSYELDSSYSKIDNPYDLELQKGRAIKEAQYMKDNIRNIIDIFSQANIGKTTKTMNKLRNQRAKILFGRTKGT